MALAAISISANAANPFLPLWEYIPDGEPYVFEDPDAPGKMRVYVYGSHDNLRDKYCGRDQVVWSAPVEDLNKWRFDGVIFRSLNGADGKPYKTRDGGAVNETTWHQVTAWEGRDMPDLSTITKGAPIHVTGRLRTFKYTNTEGQERQLYEVVANRIRVLTEEEEL